MCTDYEPSEFGSKVLRQAKKPHACSECERQILPGEEYEYATGKWEGEMSTFKTCRHCVAARDWLIEQCDGYAYGGVRQDLEDHRDEYGSLATMALLRLIVGMRRRWKCFYSSDLMAVPRSTKKSGALAAWLP